MAIPPNVASEKKRVKVYELRVNDWFDRGTGFCCPHTIHDEAKVHVESEDEPVRELLDLCIKKGDTYQKQQETLIVWTDPDGVDMALSFQEAEGCGIIWDLISGIQQRLLDGHGEPRTPRPYISASSSPPPDNAPSPLHLPPAQLQNLQQIEDVIRRGTTTQQAREVVLKLIFPAPDTSYISQLTAMVDVAEDLESLPDLHRLCNIMRTLILYNDSNIIEWVVRDDQILGFVGALEYDPDFPNHKANHRQFLADASKFKEVVPMRDPAITRKIHCTYRLQYLKDVVLARVLDDPTFNVLNSLIFFNQVDIVQAIQADSDFLTQLVNTISSPTSDPGRRCDGVFFIQQCCAIAKGLQITTRAALYRNLIECGLFSVITFALQHSDATVRVAGTDVLVALIDHDALMIRSHILKAINEKMKPMTEILIELLHVETDLGVKAQTADAMKVLLDCNNQGPQQERMGDNQGTFLAKFRINASGMTTTHAFLDHFYRDPRAAKNLFGPLRELMHRPSLDNLTIQEVSLFSHLIEILSFIVRQPKYSRAFILEEGLVARVASLIRCSEKHLKLAAIKYFRVCLSLADPDGFHRRQMVQHSLFEPVLDMIEATMPRDNLLSSSGLEMFEFIRRENVRPVIFHLVENFRERLEAIKFVETFQGIILRYEQFLNPPPPPPPQPEHEDSSFMTSDAGTPNTRQHIMINGGDPRWQAQLRENVDEDSYFEGDEDEDELGAGEEMSARPMNGGASSRPLVDYDDDDDDDEEDEEDDDDDEAGEHTSSRTELNSSGEVEKLPSSDTEASLSGTDEERSTPPTTSGSTPILPSTPELPSTRGPPSLLEKRRREEDDDDDELGKLSQGVKRRNSSAGAQLLPQTADSSDGDAVAGSVVEDKNADKPVLRSQSLRRGRSLTSKATVEKNGKIAFHLGARANDQDAPDKS